MLIRTIELKIFLSFTPDRFNDPNLLLSYLKYVGKVNLQMDLDPMMLHRVLNN